MVTLYLIRTRFHSNSNLSGIRQISPLVSGYPELNPNLKLYSGSIQSGTPGTSPQVDGYHELDLPTRHTRAITALGNGNETRDLTSTGTPDTLTMVNGYSPVQNLKRRKDDEKDLDDSTHTV